MLSLVPVESTTQPTTVSPTMQKIGLQALSLRDALILGVVTGFALAAGNLIFNKVSKRFRWQS